MKRSICLILSLLLLLGLTACQKKQKSLLDPNSPVTITVWHYYNGVQQTEFDEMVEEFNNTVGLEQGIIVEANSKNSVGELAQSVLASARKEPGSDEAPVIFATYAETAYQLDKLGLLVDLSQYLTEQELEEYVDAYLEEGSLGQKGVLKIFPTAKSTEVMMLNITDWQAFAQAENIGYGDLVTWEALAEVAGKYYAYTDAQTPEVPNDGRAFFGRDAVANYMVVGARQLGHPFAEVGADGSVTVSADKETLRRLWENFYVPFVKGFYAAESRFRSDDAKIGAIIALIGSTSGATYYPTEVTINDEYSYPIENVVLPVPRFEGTEATVVQQGAGMSVLKSGEKAEYAAAVFLKWFTETDRNLLFAAGSGYLPVKDAANDFSVFQAHQKELGISETMMNTFRVATGEIAGSRLYTSPPFDEASAVRDYVEDAMESAAVNDRRAVCERIAAGEAAEAVWAEYTSDDSFERWFAAFETGLKEIAGR